MMPRNRRTIIAELCAPRNTIDDKQMELAGLIANITLLTDSTIMMMTACVDATPRTILLFPRYRQASAYFNLYGYRQLV